MTTLTMPTWIEERSNCTFMELKFGGDVQVITFKLVLIVPLWN